MNKLVPILLLVALGCQELPDPQMVIDKAIETHGVQKLREKKTTFTFRNKEYACWYSEGEKMYSRVSKDSTGITMDVLFNSTTLKRYKNDTLVELTDEWKNRYVESVNSVLYFFQLPYGLNDQAVQKKYLGEVYLFKKPYHKIQITFEQEGGGADYQDVFVYWIHRDDYTLDYLAYSYQTDGGGTRFRQAINRREVDGITFQDYINFKGKSKNLPVEKHDEYFENGELTELSRIINENVRVE